MTVSRLHAVPFAGDRNFSDVAFVAAIAAGLQAISILATTLLLAGSLPGLLRFIPKHAQFSGPVINSVTVYGGVVLAAASCLATACEFGFFATFYRQSGLVVLPFGNAYASASPAFPDDTVGVVLPGLLLGTRPVRDANYPMARRHFSRVPQFQGRVPSARAVGRRAHRASRSRCGKRGLENVDPIAVVCGAQHNGVPFPLARVNCSDADHRTRAAHSDAMECLQNVARGIVQRDRAAMRAGHGILGCRELTYQPVHLILIQPRVDLDGRAAG